MTVEVVQPRKPPTAAYVLGGLALVAMLAMSIFFFAGGLLAPLWAVILLCAIWVVLFALGLVWIRRHPWRVLILPVIAAAVWVGGISAGSYFLGWTA